MKYPCFTILVLFIHSIVLALCAKDDLADGSFNNTNPPTGSKMIIKIGSHTFKATLFDNATANAFKSRLPMTINMIELNGNEKFADLAADLPTNAANPGSIHAGDLMMYGSSTLVIFYKSFSTSYSYTKLGRIDDVKGLEAALGKGNITISFALE